MESRGCLHIEEEKEDCPENFAGRKVPPVPVRDDKDFSTLCDTSAFHVGNGHCWGGCAQSFTRADLVDQHTSI